MREPDWLKAWREQRVQPREDREQAAIAAGHPEWLELPANTKEARAFGAKLFFSGKPCPQGHVGLRWTGAGRCRKCQLDRQRNQYQSNPKFREGRLKQNRKRWADPETRERDHERKRERWAGDLEFRERQLELKRQYLQSPGGRIIILARVAARRALKLKATPSWLTDEQKAACRVFYEEAGRLTTETGIKRVVDHIVPLRCKDRATGNHIACGFHVPCNLRVLTEAENLAKGPYGDLAASDAEVFIELVAKSLARPRGLLAAE